MSTPASKSCRSSSTRPTTTSASAAPSATRARIPTTRACAPAAPSRPTSNNRRTSPPDRRYPWSRSAPWRSGYAAACKAVYTGSIPVGASLRGDVSGGLRRHAAAGLAAEQAAVHEAGLVGLLTHRAQGLLALVADHEVHETSATPVVSPDTRVEAFVLTH